MAAQQQNQQRAVLNWMLQNMDPASSQMALIQMQQQHQQLLVAAAAAATLKAKNPPSKEQQSPAQVLMAKLIASVAHQQKNLFQEQNPATIAAQQLIIGQLQRQFAQQINNSSNTPILTKENLEKTEEKNTPTESKGSTTPITPSC